MNCVGKHTVERVDWCLRESDICGAVIFTLHNWGMNESVEPSSVLTPLGPWSRLAFDYLVLIPGRNQCLLLCFHSSLSHLEPESQWGTLVNDLVIYSAQMIHRSS